MPMMSLLPLPASPGGHALSPPFPPKKTSLNPSSQLGHAATACPSHPPAPPSHTLTHALTHQHTHTHTTRTLRSVVVNALPDVREYEMALLANLQPDTVEEALALVPWLADGRFPPHQHADLQDVLEQIVTLKQTQ